MASIDTAFVQQFADNLIQLSQQKGTRLRPLVMEKMVEGQYANFDRIGQMTAQKLVARHSDTPIGNADYTRRRVQMEDFVQNLLLDEQDEVRMIIDPTSTYANQIAYALGRRMDDVILNAATGDALTISASAGAGAGSTVSFPSGQTVDEDIGSTDSNLNIEKLIAAKRKLLENDVDIASEPVYIAVNASAQDSLLGTDQIQSRDYNEKPALVDGEIDRYLGFQFIHSQRLLGTADGTDSDPKQIIVWTPSGIGFAVGNGQDMTTQIDKRPDKNYATQVYGSTTFGATRVEDEKVVKIECVQS